jgi:uridine kinase
MRLGPSSAEGYYLDSHQLSAIVDDLLVPFHEGAAEVLQGAFDEPADSHRPLRTPVPTSAILIFDGLFLHRPELRAHWDLSVMLHADRRCDGAWLRYLETDLPSDTTARAAELDRRLEAARWPRYRHGWLRYRRAIGAGAADVDIDNDDLLTPSIIEDGVDTWSS